MPRGAPARKLAITVDQDIHDRVLRAAHEDKVSVSAWLTDAARRCLRIRDGLTAVEEWEAQHGALTDEEIDAARRHVRQKHVRRPPSARSRVR